MPRAPPPLTPTLTVVLTLLPFFINSFLSDLFDAALIAHNVLPQYSNPNPSRNPGSKRHGMAWHGMAVTLALNDLNLRALKPNAATRPNPHIRSKTIA